MFTVSNLRKEKKDGWVRLVCDFDTSALQKPFREQTMWIAVEEENEGMLADDVYDPFVLLPLYIGMHYGQDVHIEGNISPRLYHNVTHYIMNIFDRFSDETHPVSFTVKGFDKGPGTGKGKLIGTGISCGADSLVTIYDNFVMEKDPDYRINSLFFFNHGSHGDYEDKKTKQIWMDRAALNKKAAEELGLPMYLVDSNLHAYTHAPGLGGQKIGYLASWSIAVGLEKAVKRYVTSANLSYDEIAEFSRQSRDFDISEYSESYLPNLVQTERMELVMDGCQYSRAEKMERISEWPIAQKYLNVCLHPVNHGHNCSCCEKCMWSLIPLEAVGKLENFKSVFDIGIYRKNAFRWKCHFLSNYGKNSMQTSLVRHAKSHGMKLPPIAAAKVMDFTRRGFGKIGRILSRSTK